MNQHPSAVGFKNKVQTKSKNKDKRVFFDKSTDKNLSRLSKQRQTKLLNIFSC